MSTRTGYQLSGGTRERITWHESTRIAGFSITLWRTGDHYTIETFQECPDGFVKQTIPLPLCTGSDSAARCAFERHVEMHYECPECGAPTFNRTHICPARD